MGLRFWLRSGPAGLFKDKKCGMVEEVWRDMCSVVGKMSNILYWSMECEEFEHAR